MRNVSIARCFRRGLTPALSGGSLLFLPSLAFAQPATPNAATPQPQVAAAPSADAPGADAPAAAPAASVEPIAPADAAAAPAATPSEPSADSPEPTPGKMLLLPQTAPITGPRTVRYHDGFYLRANFGLGLLWGGFETAEPDAHLDVDGSGITLDLLVGGSPSPGFAIGGGLVGNWLFGADFETDAGQTSAHDVTSGLIGVFVDGFPQPGGGWHLGGLIGVGGHTLSKDAVADETGGFGGAIWAGYDQWVGDDVSVGGLLRFTAMRSTGDKGGQDITASTASLGVLFSALYH